MKSSALILALVFLFGLVGCQPSARLAAAPTLPPVETPRATPAPVRLPADDAPHDNLTEWWYYTGHLWSEDGRRYGFEVVIFQSVRGQNPIGYLSHVAVTDPQRGRFQYGSKAATGRSIPSRLDLDVEGWSIQGGGGTDHLTANLEDYALELTVAGQKPEALHLGGYISFGPAGDSYYYSRTRNAVSGRVRDGDEWVSVTGLAWFDHQWGDFIVSSVAGWDWFSLQLDNQSEFMLFVLRNPEGERSPVFGTYIDPAGRTLDLTPDNVAIESLGSWTSPHTGAVYPSGWRVRTTPQPNQELPPLDLQLSPLLVDQELAFETAYWEGVVDLVGTSDGARITGEGYVELTGYRP